MRICTRKARADPGLRPAVGHDAIGAVRGLRDGEGLQVMGSSKLASQLVEHDLVDEYRLMIEPILLGGGKRIFPDDGQARPLDSSSRPLRPRPES